MYFNVRACLIFKGFDFGADAQWQRRGPGGDL